MEKWVQLQKPETTAWQEGRTCRPAASTAEQDLVLREKGLSGHVEFLLLKGPGMTTY